MAIGLRSLKGSDLLNAIRRRLEKNTKGLGYWGAYDAQKYIKHQKEISYGI